MRRLLLAIMIGSILVLSGCGALNRTSSVLTGQPNEYRFADGVRCYESQSGSMSCVVVK